MSKKDPDAHKLRKPNPHPEHAHKKHGLQHDPPAKVPPPPDKEPTKPTLTVEPPPAARLPLPDAAPAEPVKVYPAPPPAPQPQPAADPPAQAGKTESD